MKIVKGKRSILSAKRTLVYIKIPKVLFSQTLIRWFQNFGYFNRILIGLYKPSVSNLQKGLILFIVGRDDKFIAHCLFPSDPYNIAHENISWSCIYVRV